MTPYLYGKNENLITDLGKIIKRLFSSSRAEQIKRFYEHLVSQRYDENQEKPNKLTFWNMEILDPFWPSLPHFQGSKNFQLKCRFYNNFRYHNTHNFIHNRKSIVKKCKRQKYKSHFGTKFDLVRSDLGSKLPFPLKLSENLWFFDDFMENRS